MPRIQPVAVSEATPSVRNALEHHERHHGRITNMKRTLAHSLPSFHALMEWYPLRDEVQVFLGPRLTTLYAHAISAETDCLICSTFFRRLLIEGGENPDNLELDEREKTVVAFGQQLVQNPNHVSDALYAQLKSYFSDSQIVTLTVFGGVMIATNVFNNALKVDLDDYLEPFRFKGKTSQNKES